MAPAIGLARLRAWSAGMVETAEESAWPEVRRIPQSDGELK